MDGGDAIETLRLQQQRGCGVLHALLQERECLLLAPRVIDALANGILKCRPEQVHDQGGAAEEPKRRLRAGHLQGPALGQRNDYLGVRPALGIDSLRAPQLVNLERHRGIDAQRRGRVRILLEERLEERMQLLALLVSALEQHLAIRDVDTFIGKLLQRAQQGAVVPAGILDVDVLPSQRVDRQGVQVIRVDTAAPEGFHECDAVAVGVIGDQVEVRRDDAPEVFPKGDVESGNVVQGANAHPQDVACHLRRFGGEPSSEIRVDRSWPQHASAVRVDAIEVRGAALVDEKERIEEGCDEQRATAMWLHLRCVGFRVRCLTRPVALSIDRPDRIAECPAPPGCVTELGCQAGENRLTLQVAAAAPDLVLQNLPEGEVLHQRDDIRKALVERQHIRIGRLRKAVVHAIENRVRRLMRDDIVGEATEDR